MGSPVTLRDDFDAEVLRLLAKRTRDADQGRRLLALAAICDGGSRSDAARVGSVGLQTVRDRVLRFDAAGPDGLVDGKAPGRTPKLDDARRQALARIVEEGRSRRCTRWCAGGRSIWRDGSGGSFASRSRSRR